ncbi:MAG: twin-arginine translocase TatA/TatE family subunit [Candidatus Thermoplasmatota archaeon]|nr:twin-arginine translocase TatA/TatE family subunit [Candidatus Thermoplasmatota archaeon]
MQGMEWIILVLVIVFLLFGASKIPKLARALGKAKGEFNKGKNELTKEMKDWDKEDTDTTPKKEKRSKIARAAKDLGIDIKGKSDDELKKGIAKSVGEK